MQTATQESTTTETLTLETPDLTQAEYEQIRGGKEVVREKSAPEAKASSKTVDESDTSKLTAKDGEDEDESDVESDEASEIDKPKKKSGTQRRIEKLVKERENERREKEYLREQLQQYQTKPKDEAKAAPAVTSDGEPKSDDFETYDAYVRALTKWEAKELLRERDAETEKKSAQAKVTERVKTHNERVDAFRKEQPDFDKHLANFFEGHGADFNVSAHLQDELTGNEKSAQILFELVKTPEEFERINSLDAVGVARAIGRLEAKLSLATDEKQTETETKTKTTKAPPPVAPISANNSGTVKKSIYDESVDFQQYERMRREQMGKKRA